MSTAQTKRNATLENCDPRRYGKLSVIMHCPHGCVTQCERERREAQAAPSSKA